MVTKGTAISNRDLTSEIAGLTKPLQTRLEIAVPFFEESRA